MDDDCPICLESMKDDNALCKTECGHKFHSKCIFNSIVLNVKCPICRTKLAENRKQKILFVERYDPESNENGNNEHPNQTRSWFPYLQFLGRRNTMVDLEEIEERIRSFISFEVVSGNYIDS